MSSASANATLPPAASFPAPATGAVKTDAVVVIYWRGGHPKPVQSQYDARGYCQAVLDIVAAPHAQGRIVISGENKVVPSGRSYAPERTIPVANTSPTYLTRVAVVQLRHEFVDFGFEPSAGNSAMISVTASAVRCTAPLFTSET